MSNVQYKRIGGLLVHPVLEKTVSEEVCSGTEISEAVFWSTLESLIVNYGPKNEALLRKRDSLQAQIDAYHLENIKSEWDAGDYTRFLAKIGYLVPEGPDFKIETTDVDPEIASIAGPQLVVPVDKARFALNAANARWGSLMDAFYGTDAGPPEDPGYEKGSNYNPKRGEKVFEYTQRFLDDFFGLKDGAKYGDVTEFKVDGKSLTMKTGSGVTSLKNSAQFVGFNDKDGVLTEVLLKNNDLHCIIQIDRNHSVGKTHKAGVKDVILESAVTAICDFEDSVAAVDAHDKSIIYRNWARLMKNTLEEKFEKNGKVISRKLKPDRKFKGVDGKELVLPGRVVLLVRNVGLHMYTNAVKIAKTGQDVPEGFVDLVITAVSALHDVGANANQKSAFNSRTGSIYIVKPKQHGPEEVRFTCECFTHVEDMLNLKRNLLKIGVMDEERRTTVNLKECIREAKSRLIFINTGFMDRTGDEFRTSTFRGPYLTKDFVKKASWLQAYEDWNVDVGIQCGLVGVAQIGKGMWAEPDSMRNMLEKKIGHPKSGATCAWVPSPTAATIHAIHYHQVYVKKVLADLKKQGKRAKLSDILTPPLVELFTKEDFSLTKAVVKKELDNNAQSILGYVVRWVLMGVGCSKVPDINDVALMEDRATLRINSQLIVNWLLHGVVSKDQVLDSFKKMAVIVDAQNKGQSGYQDMSKDFDRNNGFLCALEMVFKGLDCPNGLTEFSLTKFRLAEKQSSSKSKL